MKNKEIKKYDNIDNEKLVANSINMLEGKESVFKKIKEEILPTCESKNKRLLKIANNDFRNSMEKLARIFESKSHVGLRETFTERYKMLSYEMTEKNIEEFKCSNEIEKALAETITNSYIRILDNSRRLNSAYEASGITQLHINYISSLSKQIERAYRQFNSSILTLKQLKSPQIELNIKATTAFVANSQQVNVQKDEIIKAQ